MIYIQIAIALFLFQLVSVKLSKQFNFILYSFSVFILVVFIGLRFETGGSDWTVYKIYFEYVSPLSELLTSPSLYFYNYWGHGFEPFFKFYSSFLKIFSDDYRLLIFISSLFSLTVVSKFFYKSSPYPYLSLMIYYSSVGLLGDMTVTRQMIAVAIFILSIESIVNKKPLIFFILTSCAFLFHYSAIILFPIYYVYHGTKDFNNYFILIVILIVISITVDNKIMKIIEIVVSSINLGWVFELKMNQYLSEVKTAEISFGFGTIERFFTLFFIYIYKNIIIELNPKYGKIIIFLALFNILLSIVFLDFNSVYLRFRYFFIFANSILLIYLIVLVKQKLFMFSLVFFYAIFWIYLTVFGNPDLYLPYQNSITFEINQDKVDRLKLIEKRY